MTTILLIVASIGSALSAWHLQRITSPDQRNTKRAVRISGIFAISVIIIAGFNQYEANIKEKALRSMEIDLSVAENIAGRRISILDNFFKLYALSPTISIYVKYNIALKKESIENNETLSWETVANKKTRESLQEARDSFDALQNQAKELLDLSIRYPKRVPDPVISWASKTVKIKFIEVPNYISSYKNTTDVQDYEKSIGLATGSAISSVISATKNLLE